MNPPRIKPQFPPPPPAPSILWRGQGEEESPWLVPPAQLQSPDLYSFNSFKPFGLKFDPAKYGSLTFKPFSLFNQPASLLPGVPLLQIPYGPAEPEPKEKPIVVDPLGVSKEVWKINGWVPTTEEQWLSFAVQLFNNVHSLDLDFTSLPVNRGSGLCRFSEYAPNSELQRPCSIKVHPHTTARAHGEIRPIKGLNESWITRVTLDFKPNVWYMSPGFPDLEIDGFTAVDPPLMKFDFSKGRQSVQSMRGGNYGYENPQVSGSKLVTPFDSVAEAPPDNHNYWMFRFNPVATNLLGGIMEKTSDGENPLSKKGLGALLLWAFLPTFGVMNEERFKEHKVPFNTFPRRLGDLISLLSPMFETERGHAMKLAAPFYNPNNEYMAPYTDVDGNLLSFPKKWREVDAINEKREKQCAAEKQTSKGVCLPPIGRQPIPESTAEVLKLNERMKSLGLPPVPRKRGSVVDWIFADIAKDPKRLKAMSDYPRAILHLKMRPTTLNLPFGKLKIDSSSDIRAYYLITPVENPVTKELETRVGLRIDVEPLKIEDVDLELFDYNLVAKSLRAKKLVIDIPSIPGLGTEDPANRPPWTFALQGIEAEGFKFWNDSGELKLGMGKANIASLSFVKKRDSQHVTIKGVSGNGLEVDSPLGHVEGTDFNVAERDKDGKEQAIQISTGFEERGGKMVPRFFSVKVPEIQSKIGLQFSHKPSETEVGLEGSASLKNISYYREIQDHQTITEAKLELSGIISTAKLKNPVFGSVKFTTQEDPSHPHSITGDIQWSSVKPKQPSKDQGTTKFDLNLDLPYVSFESDGVLKIPAGSSTLKNSQLTLSVDKEVRLKHKGTIDLNKASHLGTEKLTLGRFQLTPNLSNISIQGDFEFEMTPQGFKLGPPASSSNPLQIKLDLDGSKFHHQPDLTGSKIDKVPESKVIQTEVQLSSAKVLLENLRNVQTQRVLEAGKFVNKITQLDAGPITVHHIQGSGSIWVNLFLWGYVRGLFPIIGSQNGPKAKRPDPAPLTAHLPADEKKTLRDLLGSGDFFRLGQIKIESDPGNEWKIGLKEVLLNIHEDGGREQFGLIRLPEFTATNKPGQAPFSLGPGGFLANIYLNDPERGGYFRVQRWK